MCEYSFNGLYWVLVTSMVAGLGLLSACGQSDPEVGVLVCDGEKLQATVEASGWVQDTTEIVRYRYRGSLYDNRLEVDLLGDGEKLIGTLVTRQIQEEDAPEFGSVEATFELAQTVGQPSVRLRLESRGAQLPSGYRVALDMQQIEPAQDAPEVLIEAFFERARCPQADAPEAGSGMPVCVQDLPLDNPAVSLPSCGMLYEPMAASGRRPDLRALRYSVPADPQLAPPHAGGAALLGAQKRYTLEVYKRTALTDPAVVQGWLEAVGADAVIGTPAELLFSAAFLDDAWRTQLQDHAELCWDPARDTPADANLTEQTLSGCKQTLAQSLSDGDDTLHTRRQAAGPCGSASNRDSDSWGNSGRKDNSGGNCASGCATGDPHIVSLDGVAFDFQGAGEYWLAEAFNGAAFALQGRLEPLGLSTPYPACDNVTVITAIGTRMGEQRVAIYAREEVALWVDGAPFDPATQALELPEGASIEQIDDTNYRLQWPDGSALEVSQRGASEVSSLNLNLTLVPSRLGQIRGLMGSYNDNLTDEFITRTGAVLPQPIAFDQLYDEFGDSWRIAADESLFDYQGVGEDTDTFTIAGFPTMTAGIEDFPEELIDESRQTCLKEHITDPVVLQGCILDVVCTQDYGFAEAAAELDSPLALASIDPDESLILSGAIRKIAPPESVQKGAFSPSPLVCLTNADHWIRIFKERSDDTLDDAVAVDFQAPGDYQSPDDLRAATLAAGTRADTYFLHFDLLDQPRPLLPTRASVVFPREIIGVIATPASLAATDRPLGLEATEYPTDLSTRGLDWDLDAVSIGADGRTLSLNWRGYTSLNQIRVLIKAD